MDILYKELIIRPFKPEIPAASPFPPKALQFAGAWSIFLLNQFRLCYNLLGRKDMCWGICCAAQPCAKSSKVTANSRNLATATSVSIFMVQEPHVPWCVGSLIICGHQIVFLSWGEGKYAGAYAVQPSHMHGRKHPKVNSATSKSIVYRFRHSRKLVWART